MTLTKTALTRFALGGALIAAVALSSCAGPAGYGSGNGYGQYSYSGGSYSGDVYFNGTWHSGPFRYRDNNGGRQYWQGGSWHNGQTRPGQGDNRGPGQGNRGY